MRRRLRDIEDVDRNVERTAREITTPDRAADDRLNCGDQIVDAETLARPDIERPQRAIVAGRLVERACHIPDVYVVAHDRPISPYDDFFAAKRLVEEDCNRSLGCIGALAFTEWVGEPEHAVIKAVEDAVKCR